MHKCVRCGRAANSIEEIDAGCPCGSKAFVYVREVDSQAAPAKAELVEDNVQPAPANSGAAQGTMKEDPQQREQAPVSFEGAMGASQAPTPVEGARAASGQAPVDVAKDAPGQAPSKSAKSASGEGSGKAPASYHARMTFTSEDVENIKVLTEGVFLLDVSALSRGPMVLKDEEGVYYVKLPFEQKKQNGKEKGGNGLVNGGNGSAGKA